MNGSVAVDREWVVSIANPIIVCATALTLVLAGCDVNIEATDLSAVAVENDRTTVERVLGKPDEVVEVQGLTVASYTYDKGYHASAESPTNIPYPGTSGGFGTPGGFAALGWLLISAVAAPIDHAARTSEARPGQIGKLAVIYGADDKLLFAGALDHPDVKINSLEVLTPAYKASQSDDAEALLDLARIALISEQRLTFLRSAADVGDAEASYELGKTYSRGEGVEQSDTRALEWWRKSASQHHVPAYMQIANAYRFGNGVPRDAGEAMVWLTKAAEAGDLKAQNILLEITGSEKRFETLLARAEDGHPAFQIEVADSYRFGIDVPKDIDLAIRMYERAAAGKNDYAAYALGKIYADGETGISNLSRAFMWYSIAEQIASGDEEELYRLKDELSEAMTPMQVAEAERMAREWLEAHPQ